MTPARTGGSAGVNVGPSPAYFRLFAANLAAMYIYTFRPLNRRAGTPPFLFLHVAATCNTPRPGVDASGAKPVFFRFVENNTTGTVGRSNVSFKFAGKLVFYFQCRPLKSKRYIYDYRFLFTESLGSPLKRQGNIV